MVLIWSMHVSPQLQARRSYNAGRAPKCVPLTFIRLKKDLRAAVGSQDMCFCEDEQSQCFQRSRGRSILGRTALPPNFSEAHWIMFYVRGPAGLKVSFSAPPPLVCGNAIYLLVYKFTV